jgi:hypothetical protein
MDIPFEFQAWVNAPTNSAAQKVDEAPLPTGQSATTADATA